MEQQGLDAFDVSGRPIVIDGVVTGLESALLRAGRPHAAVTRAQETLRRVRQDVIAEGQAVARKAVERQQAIAGMAAGKVAVGDGLRVVFELEPYRDQPGSESHARRVLREVERAARHQVFGLLNMAAADIWAHLASVCADCVEKVRVLPDPGPLYAVPHAQVADEAARRGYGDAWAVHLDATDRFTAAHDAAVILRTKVGGVTPGVYPGGAPTDVAVMFRHWWRWMEETNGVAGFRQRSGVHRTLRLRWAVDRDWQPGLWRPDEVSAGPPPEPKKRFASKLVHMFGADGDAEFVA